MTEEATEQPAPALARDEIDVADKFRAALAPLQCYLAAVEGFQLGAMGDADAVAIGSSWVSSSIILS